MAEMQVQVTRHYTVNLGDHGEGAIKAYPYDPDETVADLVKRVMEFPVSRYRDHDPTEFVILRVVSGTEPKEADDGTAPF